MNIPLTHPHSLTLLRDCIHATASRSEAHKRSSCCALLYVPLSRHLGLDLLCFGTSLASDYYGSLLYQLWARVGCHRFERLDVGGVVCGILLISLSGDVGWGLLLLLPAKAMGLGCDPAAAT